VARRRERQGKYGKDRNDHERRLHDEYRDRAIRAELKNRIKKEQALCLLFLNSVIKIAV
jgi:hypothetical protein